MLLFRSEEDLADWCERHHRRPGGVVPLDRLRELGALWYGDRLDPDWRPRSRQASQRILHEVGLTGPFWELP